MNTVIWKYDLQIEPMFSLELPAKARILTMQMQFDKPVMWCAVDPDAPRVIRRFGLIATGNQVAFDLPKYIGTFQLFGGATVLHLFEFYDELKS